MFIVCTYLSSPVYPRAFSSAISWRGVKRESSGLPPPESLLAASCGFVEFAGTFLAVALKAVGRAAFLVELRDGQRAVAVATFLYGDIVLFHCK